MPDETNEATRESATQSTEPAPEDKDSRRLRAALRGTFPASDPPASWAGQPRSAEDQDEDEDEDEDEADTTAGSRAAKAKGLSYPG